MKKALAEWRKRLDAVLLQENDGETIRSALCHYKDVVEAKTCAEEANELDFEDLKATAPAAPFQFPAPLAFVAQAIGLRPDGSSDDPSPVDLTGNSEWALMRSGLQLLNAFLDMVSPRVYVLRLAGAELNSLLQHLTDLAAYSASPALTASVSDAFPASKQRLFSMQRVVSQALEKLTSPNLLHLMELREDPR